jgi:hypothetical protein
MKIYLLYLGCSFLINSICRYCNHFCTKEVACNGGLSEQKTSNTLLNVLSRNVPDALSLNQNFDSKLDCIRFPLILYSPLYGVKRRFSSGRRHGLTRIMTRPAMCDFCDVGRLNTFTSS